MDLTHHFLLSMPTLADSWFDKSITYISDSEHQIANSYNVNKFGIGVSSSIDSLTELAVRQGPDSHLLLLGYAGWAAGLLLVTAIQKARIRWQSFATSTAVRNGIVSMSLSKSGSPAES